jgi:2,3-bisphosphoglycerate-independent phosphoglycerate mutase
MKNTRPKPITLVILDGWGYREEREANAIALAHTPFWDHLWQTYPHTLISGSGRCVGLPDGQMGNSEVGHLNMGAGRIVQQDLTRIDAAIADQSFFSNPILVQTIKQAQATNKAVHILGLLSDGGVHSHDTHFYALIELAARMGFHDLYLHPFLDGRDTPPQSAAGYLKTLQATCDQFKTGKIASIIGRYYAMDRDKRWERVQKAYDLLTDNHTPCNAATAAHALEQAYARGETDEFVQPTHIANTPVIQDGDSVIFMNFRADRARELTTAFIDPDFNGFSRKNKPTLANYVCLTEYDTRFKTPIAFPPQPLTHLFAEYISEKGLTQLRIAETEKYAHVTFFFNGGIEKPFAGEERVLIPSPKVATYDLQPEMSARELTEKLTTAIQSDQYDVIICNFANPDMVGHSGNLAATIKAIEVIDECLQKVTHATLATGGELLITADHGNAEQMFDKTTNQPHTAHTSDPVPFIYIGRKAEITHENGKLSDISPTLLYLLGLPIPSEMTGKTLLHLIQ